MKRESTNDKIVRLYKEGTPLAEIAEEVDITIGAVQAVLESRDDDYRNYTDMRALKKVPADKPYAEITVADIKGVMENLPAPIENQESEAESADDTPEPNVPENIVLASDLLSGNSDNGEDSERSAPDPWPCFEPSFLQPGAEPHNGFKSAQDKINNFAMEQIGILNTTIAALEEKIERYRKDIDEYKSIIRA